MKTQIASGCCGDEDGGDGDDGCIIVLPAVQEDSDEDSDWEYDSHDNDDDSGDGSNDVVEQ